MALLNQHFDVEFVSCITGYLERAFEKREHMAIVGQTVSIGYKHGMYQVTTYNIKDKSLTTMSFRQAELGDAVNYFLIKYWDDPVGHLFEDADGDFNGCA